MVKRKASRAKKTARKKKAARPKKAVRLKQAARARKLAGARKIASTKASRGKRAVRAPGGAPVLDAFSAPEDSRLGPGTGGQSGDIEGLHNVATADSESVEELAEEGQGFEAEVIDAVEDAPDPDQGELKTREVPEDDVPQEYDDQ
jgi:hypothetical protein